ncbi:acyltransferase [Sulfurifustis variabilis]|uniref:Acyltransferase n=1 Tax=Sulfurifustis variabilis TaxID=1675686 RepID=A0A1B4V291_9GAMM|nr:AMP-binding protein [Sulfurifustis variabilis]BAU47636.1 acyltransferase [Sulfurifustis variabilis]
MDPEQASRPTPDLAAALLSAVTELGAQMQPARPPRPATLDSSLQRDLGLDSLARVELLARLEQRCAVTLPESAFASADTPRDLLRALVAARARGAMPAVSRPPGPPEATGAERVPPPTEAQTLLDVLDWYAERAPDREHLRVWREDGEEPLSHAALRREAAAVAGGMQAAGVGPGHAVAIMLPTSREYFVSFYGALLAGAVPVPIYPPARPGQIEDHVRRHRAILENALAVMLVTVAQTRVVARLLKAQVPALRRVATVAELADEGGVLRAPRLAGADVAFLQYTSGSTGNPKGVVLTHANLLANLRAMGSVVRPGADEVFVSWLPLYHDMGLIGAWLGSLYFGIRLVVMSPLAFLARPSRWLRAIHEHRATISAGPNFAFELCLRRIEDRELEHVDLSSLRRCFNGAEAVSPATIERFGERFARFGFRPTAMMPVYGLAENALGLTFPPLDRGPRVDRIARGDFMRDGRASPARPDDETALRFVSCGAPLPGHELRIVDESGRELPEREQGRVQFRGPSATSGYFRNAEASRALFVDGWLDSGDLGYVAGGELYLTGRRKDVVIHAGRNVFPDEIEEAVGELPGVRKGRVAVFGSPDPETGTERLVVLAETREADAAAREALRARVVACVADLAGGPPDDVCLAPPQTILKTSSGKVRRAASREVYERQAFGGARRPVAWQMARLAAGALVPELRRGLRRLGAVAYAGYAWGVFGLMAPVVWALVIVLPRHGMRWTLLHRAARAFARACGVPITIEGVDALPSGDRPCLFVANHQSYLDGIVLVAALPRPVRFVAKAEFRSSLVAGLFLRRLGAQFVERFDRERGVADVRHLTALARARVPLFFFPEGTFTRAPGLLPFHTGAFVAAAEAGVPVVPCALRGTRSLLRSDSWFPRRGAVHVSIGPALAPPPSAPDTWSAAMELRDRARDWILRATREPDLSAAPAV